MECSHAKQHHLGVGQLIAGLFAWAYLPRYSCSDAADCTRANNPGWRYIWYTAGAFVFVLSILRVTVVRLEETPKFLLTEGKDEQAVRVLQNIATRYNRPCSLTIEHLQYIGQTQHRSTTRAGLSQRLISPREVAFHFRGLFATRRMGFSTALVWSSWLLIGLAYPLFNVFLPTYLASRGAKFGQPSPYITWRNYTLNNTSSIFGPMLAGFMCRSGWFWGRRGTMIIGAIVTMIFFFCYTQVRTASENVGFTCAISFCVNVYYGTLYAYTPEVCGSITMVKLQFKIDDQSGLPICPSRHRQWSCDWLQPNHGHCQRRCGRVCKCESTLGCSSSI